jgi:hypothetical protein
VVRASLLLTDHVWSLGIAGSGSWVRLAGFVKQRCVSSSIAV